MKRSEHFNNAISTQKVLSRNEPLSISNKTFIASLHKNYFVFPERTAEPPFTVQSVPNTIILLVDDQGDHHKTNFLHVQDKQFYDLCVSRSAV